MPSCVLVGGAAGLPTHASLRCTSRRSLTVTFSKAPPGSAIAGAIIEGGYEGCRGRTGGRPERSDDPGSFLAVRTPAWPRLARVVRSSRRKGFVLPRACCQGGRGVPKAEGNPARSAVAVLSVLIVLAAGALALWTARGSRDAVEPAGQVFIEIANRAGAGSNVDASQWWLVIDGQAQSLAPLGTIQNGRYRTIGDSPGDDLALALPLNPQGAVIQLMETTLVQ